jgi:hypothetical protein
MPIEATARLMARVILKRLVMVSSLCLLAAPTGDSRPQLLQYRGDETRQVLADQPGPE